MSSVTRLIGAVHIGQLKQFLTHLTVDLVKPKPCNNIKNKELSNKIRNAYLPAAVPLDNGARELEQATGTIPAGYFLDNASGASYFMAVFAVLEVFKGI